LCALSDTRSSFIASTSIGTLPAPWTASEWNRVLGFLALIALPMAARSWTTPISLLASMMLTRIVLGVIASTTISGETVPSLAGRSSVTSKPSRWRRLAESRIALCSVSTVMMWLPCLP
jgi:hypothetical protein